MLWLKATVADLNHFNMNTSAYNKELVLEFWKKAIAGRDTAIAEKLIAPNYIQHSATGKEGKEALLTALEQMKKMPLPEKSGPPFRRVIADDNLVAIHMLIEFGGMKMIVLDMVRLEEGLICEHWDSIQMIPPTMSNYMGLIAGQVDVTDDNQTVSNKVVIRRWTETLSRKKITGDVIVEFVASDVISHLYTGSGLPANFIEELSSRTGQVTHRLIGEGCFVITQSTGQIEGSSFVFYDVYRLTNKKIVEFWTVRQLVPEQMLHQNGIV